MEDEGHPLSALDRVGRPTLADDLTAQVRDRTRPVVGTEVEVVTDDVAIAKAVAPTLAKRLHPGRIFGAVIHTERHDGHYHVTVEDQGPDRRAT